VKEPKAFLFDEPLSNLDAELPVKMRGEIVALHRRLGATMIYVTHDQVEAMTMADVIVVPREGAVEQIGSPIELYVRPRNRFVACFLGARQMNLLAADVIAAGAQGLELAVDQGRARIAADAAAAGWTSGAQLTARLRPETLGTDGRGPTRRPRRDE
jgi:ABC-type sugar transport system ATPase subunit